MLEIMNGFKLNTAVHSVVFDFESCWKAKYKRVLQLLSSMRNQYQI